ncbi:arylsulfatase [Roseomonas sp. CAU 1739]|uniref:arylsulfatase n=1 Tax=Roseomonas sp. CAU 1739 TaxID=3140364 RepID=UPI00325B2A11
MSIAITLLRHLLLPVLLLCAGLPAMAQQVRGTPGAPNAVAFPDSRTLPVPTPPFTGSILPNAVDSTPAWAPQIMPPEGAPNVLLILLDDAGYASNSAFGGVIPTPTLDRLAQGGLRYTQFHTTSLCSPTRAALLTGRNHHNAGFGVVSEMATGYDGYNATIPPETAHGAATLQLNGYATAWFGKNHNIPPAEASPAGPFSHWPVGQGYDYFFGFAGGDTSQWQPGNLYRNTTPIQPFDGNPGWNLITAMADDAIRHINTLHAVSPQRPWFVHYAPGATHAPHHPPPEWIARFRGQFDEGWNVIRERIFENQKRLGVIPANAQLTPWPDELRRWDDLSADEKRLFARQAEVYAAYMAYSDHEIGRVVQAIQDLGQLDNTLIIFVTGDNGASAEGQLNGSPNESSFFNNVEIPVAPQLPLMDVWGSDRTYPHFAVGWSWAFDTPFRWTKQIASHFGGTRNGMVMHWPRRITDRGGIRTQFHHVIDVVPTILEAAGIPVARSINGITQRPFDGVSMVYTFDRANADAPSRRRTQYFEMLGNRGIYHDGWFANTIPVAPPWNGMAPRPTDVLNGFQWELFNLADDPTQFRSVASEHPDRLRMMQGLFLAEAAWKQVLPLDASALDRFLTPRPGPAAGRTQFVYTAPVSSLQDASAPNILNRAWRITAEIDVPQGGANGMLVTHGGRFGGYGLYLAEGKPTFTYNFLNIARGRWQGPALTPGRHTIVFDWQPSADGRFPLPFGRGGTGVMSVDGQAVATRSMPRTVPIIMTLDETFDVGIDTGTPVDDRDYQVPFAFTGRLVKVTVDLGASTVTPESLRDLQRMLEARNLPVVGGLIGDMEDFVQRMEQGRGP